MPLVSVDAKALASPSAAGLVPGESWDDTSPFGGGGAPFRLLAGAWGPTEGADAMASE
jgi:hypothetical protein